FALMLLVLVLLWRWCAAEETAADETRAGGLWRRSLDGVRVAARHELLRPALLQLALFAGLLLPVMTVLVPLLGHARAWSGDMTGVIVGADGLGIGVVAAAVITRGTLPRPGRVGVGGLFLAAVGMAGMAGSPTAGVAVAAGAVTGAGVGAFTTHVAPLILGNAPATHVSRVQALVTVVQTAPLLFTNSGLGALSDAIGPGVVLGCCAAIIAASALTATRSRALWHAAKPTY